MISKEQGKDLAGKVFVEHFGAEYVRANIKMLGTEIEYERKTMTVYFILYPVDLYSEYEPPYTFGYNPETAGKIIFAVRVNRKTSTTEILDVNTLD